MPGKEIAVKDQGFSVRDGPPVSYADAGRLLRLHRAADELDNTDQEGEGIASSLRSAAISLGKEAIKRHLGLQHVSNVVKLLSHQSKHHAGVADEDKGHASAALDVYRPVGERTGAGYDPALSSDEVAPPCPPTKSPCTVPQDEPELSLAFAAVPTSRMLRRTGTLPSASSVTQTAGSAQRRTLSESAM